MIKDKILLKTDGTGSFSNAVIKISLNAVIKEIRIFIRDEMKQDDMRNVYHYEKLKFYTALFCPNNGETLTYLPYAWTIIQPISIWGPWGEEPYKNFFKAIVQGWYFHIGSGHYKDPSVTWGTLFIRYIRYCLLQERK